MASRGPSVPVRVLSVRKVGSGSQFEMQWSRGAPNSWEAASRMRRDYPQLVEAFEQLQQQSAEGTADSDAPMPAAAEGSDDSEALQLRNAELALLVKQQAQRAEEQARHAQKQQQLIDELRASPAHSPQPSAQASPRLSPQQQSRTVNVASAAAAAVAAAPFPPQSRFARKEPRAQDLQEYDGASGAKLDDWLKQLAMAARLYHLTAQETVDFAGSRLREAALDWWLALSEEELAAITDRDALAAALRARFQPVTAARTAREQLDKLQQGSRGINEYIADFQRLATQIGMASLGQENALHAFERGLRRELAVELRKQGVATLQEAIALTARIGGLMQSNAAPQGRQSLHQMDVDDRDDGSASRLDRIEAALNAMATRNTDGMGAKTHTHHGYTQQRESQRGGHGRGGARGGGRGGFKPRGPPEVPGVPEHVVRQRLDAQQCVRCGQDGHRSPACPNAICITARGN